MSNSSVVTVPAKAEDGVKSGVTVSRDDVFTVSGSGRAAYGRDATTYPDGTRYIDGKYAGAYMKAEGVVPGAPIGTLIVRVGSGPWFAAGSAQTFRALEDGEVIVAYNDWPGKYGDNSGEYVATVENHGSI
ncbi:LecA/PA-IL family lectin [Nocardia sp. NPDC051911]|uniref:LecA/PA-IL family lectin n=1 Tax=Nocardia sp. NPDC051911 TaxID=3154648 RepID=UPI00341B1AB7